jgi:hypothetical protein
VSTNHGRLPLGQLHSLRHGGRCGHQGAVSCGVVPKGKSMAGHTQADLDEVVNRLNGRPRQTLGWKTPSEALEQALH